MRSEENRCDVNRDTLAEICQKVADCQSQLEIEKVVSKNHVDLNKRLMVELTDLEERNAEHQCQIDMMTKALKYFSEKSILTKKERNIADEALGIDNLERLREIHSKAQLIISDKNT